MRAPTKLGAFFMIKTKKHYTYFENAKIYQQLDQSESLLIRLEELSINLFYNLTFEEDPKLQNLTLTKLPKTDFNALIVSYIHLLEGVAIEAVKRISIKELDYFLREDPKNSAFSFYSPDLYKILQIGQDLYKKHFPDQIISEEDLFDNISLSFFDLSFSEQIELFEEFLAKYIYSHPLYKKQEFELEEVKDQTIMLKYSGELLNHELKNLIMKMVQKEFTTSVIIDQD